MTLYARFITNHPLANVSFAVVLLLGMLAYLGMPREQDPEINFNWLVVNTVLPGAAAEDVEKKVTDPLEEAIRTLPDIRFVSSTSRDNSSIILVRFREVSERQWTDVVGIVRVAIRAAVDHQAGVPRAGDEVKDDLGVRGGLEDRALGHQLLAQGQEVGEVAVVGDGQAAGLEIGEHRLDVADEGSAGGGVAGVADGGVAGQAVD